MRKAHEFVEEYRKKGYPDDRIKIIASMRPEPLRSAVLRVLSEADDETPTEAKVEQAAEPRAEATEVESAAPPKAEPPVSAEAPPPESVAKEQRPRATGKVEKAQNKRAGKERRKTERDYEKDLEAAKKKEVGMVVAHEQRIADLREEKEKLKSEMDEQVAALRKDLEKAGVALKRKEAEVESLKKESADVEGLRGKAKSVEKLEKEAKALRARQEEIAEAKAGIESRTAELETLLSQKETSLAEKDDEIARLSASLDEERTAHKSAVGRNDELSATVERQAEKLREFGAVQEQVQGFRETLAGLKEETSLLRESEQSKAARVAELESTAARVQEEANELQEQLTANEQALDGLRETLSSRESELESLRSHFDLEAQDLKKRAEQEVRLLQRRVRRVQKLAAMGAAVAACVIVILTIGIISEKFDASESRNRVAGQGEDVTDVIVPGRNVAVETPAIETPSTPETPTPVPNPRVLPATMTTDSEPPAIGGNATSGGTTAPAAPRTKVIRYTVKRGDSLWLIAKQQLNDGEKWRSIARENDISLTNPRVKPGDVLKITVPE